MSWVGTEDAKYWVAIWMFEAIIEVYSKELSNKPNNLLEVTSLSS